MLEPLSFVSYSCKTQGLPGGTLVKNSPAGEGDEALIDPQAGKIPWKGNGHPLPCSCLENSADSGAWWATVQGLQKTPVATEHTRTL